MLEKLGYGMEVTLRSSAATFLIGLRWAMQPDTRERAGIPVPHWDLGLVSKVILDEIFFAAELISAPIVSRDDAGRVAREISQGLELYDERGWLDDPVSFHATPSALDPQSLERFQSPWADYTHLRYESGYEPHPGEPGRERWLGYEANHTAHAWLLEHPGAPRPWLVCVPGYRMGHPMVDFTGFRASWLHRELGLNVAIPVMPLHGPRRVGRRTGDGFLTGDFLDTIHAQAQAIWDIRRLMRWLRTQGAPALGIHGVSLGGYTSALLASLEDDLDCVIAGIPAADFMRLVRTHAPEFLLEAARWIGLSFGGVDRLLRVVSPLAMPPRVPRERRYLYAGLADRLASPDHARDLWHHWERPKLAWYRGSHISFLWEAEVKRLVHDALRSCGLSSRAGP